MNDSSIGFTPVTCGSTFDEWQQSVESNFSENPRHWSVKAINSTVDPQFRLQFERMFQVPGFIDLFHCADFVLQKRILLILNKNKCVWNTAAYLELLQQTDSDVVWNKVEWQSRELETYAEKLFLKMDIGSGDYNSFTHPIIESHTLSMLAAQYGEDRVIEIIKVWIEYNIDDTFCAFTQIVEKWNSISTYPIEWSLQFVRNHSCTAERTKKFR